MVNPLVTHATYNLIFAVIMRVQIENFTFFLFCALMPWTFFAGSLVASTGPIVEGHREAIGTNGGPLSASP
jgi:ABC-type polysaccharide/polyol phosphate export permease